MRPDKSDKCYVGRRELIMSLFDSEDVKEILSIPLRPEMDD
jgi:hypothetical protein